MQYHTYIAILCKGAVALLKVKRIIQLNCLVGVSKKSLANLYSDVLFSLCCVPLCPRSQKYGVVF